MVFENFKNLNCCDEGECPPKWGIWNAELFKDADIMNSLYASITAQKLHFQANGYRYVLAFML